MRNETFPLFRDLFGTVLGDSPWFNVCVLFHIPILVVRGRWYLILHVTLLLLVQEVNL